MANRQATGKKAKHGAELVQRTRAAVLGAFDAVEAKGKKISDILAKELEENPIRFMELASKFIPKEIQAEVTHSMKATELTDDELADIAAGRSTGADQPQEGAEQLNSVH